MIVLLLDWVKLLILLTIRPAYYLVRLWCQTELGRLSQLSTSWLFPIVSFISINSRRNTSAMRLTIARCISSFCLFLFFCGEREFSEATTNFTQKAWLLMLATLTLLITCCLFFRLVLRARATWAIFFIYGLVAHKMFALLLNSLSIEWLGTWASLWRPDIYLTKRLLRVGMPKEKSLLNWRRAKLIFLA